MEQIRTKRLRRAGAVTLLGVLMACTAAAAQPVAELVEQAAQAQSMEDYGAAERLYRQALAQEPGNTDLMMGLAAVLSYRHKTGAALRLYEKVLRLQPERSDARAGIGRMLFWTDRPYGALRAYGSVLAADSGNEEALRNSAVLRRSVAVHGAAAFKSISELEDETSLTGTERPFQEYRISKRVHDAVELQAGAYLDFSEKRYVNHEAGVDTVLQRRSFDQLYGRMRLFLPGGDRLLGYGAFSSAERDWTGYGAVWEGSRYAGPVAVRYTAGAGYEYFYYWTGAGRDHADVSLNLAYRGLSLDGSCRLGRVRENDLFRADAATGDTVQFRGGNPFAVFTASAAYAVPLLPGLKVRVDGAYYDYTDASARYYAPAGRRTAGAGCSFSVRPGRFRITADAGAGYDDGGLLADGTPAAGGNYFKGSLRAGMAAGSVTVGIGAEAYVNPRYRAQVLQAYLER